MAVTLQVEEGYPPAVGGFSDRRIRMATWESAMAPPAYPGSLDMPTFATVRRGYDPHQVLEYVSRLTDHLNALSTQVRQLQAELSQRDVAQEEQAPTAQDEYEGVGTRVADLMRTFDRDLERLRQDAETEASPLSPRRGHRPIA